jgi:predicted Zn finger-like uncharacterized protein
LPRPKKFRQVEFLPAVTVFKPAGAPQCNLEQVVLTIEELEAIRLKDLEGLDQEECAKRMRVSRPTFQRILTTARQKVANMLTHGLALRVEGGTYQLVHRRLRCQRCHSEFELSPSQIGQVEEEVLCPKCQGTPLARIELREKRCWRYRKGWQQHVGLEQEGENPTEPKKGPDNER